MFLILFLCSYILYVIIYSFIRIPLRVKETNWTTWLTIQACIRWTTINNKIIIRNYTIPISWADAYLRQVQGVTHVFFLETKPIYFTLTMSRATLILMADSLKVSFTTSWDTSAGD